MPQPRRRTRVWWHLAQEWTVVGGSVPFARSTVPLLRRGKRARRWTFDATRVVARGLDDGAANEAVEGRLEAGCGVVLVPRSCDSTDCSPSDALVRLPCVLCVGVKFGWESPWARDAMGRVSGTKCKGPPLQRFGVARLRPRVLWQTQTQTCVWCVGNTQRKSGLLAKGGRGKPCHPRASAEHAPRATRTDGRGQATAAARERGAAVGLVRPHP